VTAMDGTRISVLELVGVAASALAVAASFLPWRMLSPAVADVVSALGVRTWSTAWGSGPLAWLPVLLLVLVAVINMAPNFGAKLPGALLLWLVCAVAALVLSVIGWIGLPQPSAEEAARLGLAPPDVSAVPGWGLYLTVISAAVSVLAALGRLSSVRKASRRRH
jgi:hypothetical protein